MFCLGEYYVNDFSQNHRCGEWAREYLWFDVPMDDLKAIENVSSLQKLRSDIPHSILGQGTIQHMPREITKVVVVHGNVGNALVFPPTLDSDEERRVLVAEKNQLLALVDRKLDG